MRVVFGLERCHAVHMVGVIGRGPFGRGDASVLASALDSLVAILIERGEVFPQFSVLRAHQAAVGDLGEAHRQRAEGRGVEFVLV